MSRFLSHLSELQPEMFVEISPELAAKLKIENGDYVCIVSLRGAIEARALVSRRIRPMNLNGKVRPSGRGSISFWSRRPVRGNAANNLVAISGEPNVTIMEARRFVCNIIPGRLPRGPDFLDWLERTCAASRPAEFASGTTAPRSAERGKIFASHGNEGKTG